MNSINHNRDRKAVTRVKLATLAVAAAVACALLPWHRVAALAYQDASQRRFEIIGVSVPLDERFGKDDGAAFVLHFSGDIHGSLEPCG